MAKKKKKKAVRHLSATTSKVKHIKRRSPRKKKKGFLSEFLSESSPEKAVISGAMGGALSVGVDAILPAQSSIVKGLTKIGLGWVTGKFTGATHVGAGMAGAGTADMIKGAFGLSEGGDGAWSKGMKPFPAFMGEDGQPLSEERAQQMLAMAGQEQASGSYLPDYFPNWNQIKRQ